MAVRLSTGLRNKFAGSVATKVDAASGVAFVQSGSLITCASGTFLTDGFRPGDTILVTNTVLNEGTYGILSISSDGTSMALDDGVVDEGVGGNPTITGYGKSLKEIFNGSIIAIYSGSAPGTADLAESGTLLLEITVDSGAFTPGSLTNALTFDAISAGKLSKSSSQSWFGRGLAEGAQGYFRIYDNQYLKGASSVSIRLQGTIGVDMTVEPFTSVVVDGISYITLFDLIVKAVS